MEVCLKELLLLSVVLYYNNLFKEIWYFSSMVLGIIGAMNEEVSKLNLDLKGVRTMDVGMRNYHMGELFGEYVVLAFSRWGKVASAVTATHMITNYEVDEILFTGVAGGADPSLNVGDVVIGSTLYQHDMDASPLFQRYEIPLLEVDSFRIKNFYKKNAWDAANDFLSKDLTSYLLPEVRKEFGINTPKVVYGEIASGDKFFASSKDLSGLRKALPNVACVDMESAAVAQVCHEYNVPFSVIRTISDDAGDSAAVDFPKFVGSVASLYSHGIVKRLIENRN